MALRQDDLKLGSLCQSGLALDLTLVHYLPHPTNPLWDDCCGVGGIHKRHMLYEVSSIRSGLRLFQFLDSVSTRWLRNFDSSGGALDEFVSNGSTWKPRRDVG